MNYGAQHVVALVDCHPDMFDAVPVPRNNEEDDGSDNDKVLMDHTRKGTSDDVERPTPFDLSMQLMQTCMEQTIEQTVIRKVWKRNCVGVLLYNTKKNRRGPHKNGEQNDHNDGEDQMDKEEEEEDDDDKMDDEVMMMTTTTTKAVMMKWITLHRKQRSIDLLISNHLVSYNIKRYGP